MSRHDWCIVGAHFSGIAWGWLMTRAYDWARSSGTGKRKGGTGR